MPAKQHRQFGVLSIIFIVIIVGSFLMCSICFLYGQHQANDALFRAGSAIETALSTDKSPAQSEVDYAGAITYLNAARQAYSENSIAKVISLIYALSTTIILGYAAKTLRLGASDKAELCDELLKKTEIQLEKDFPELLQQQNEAYVVVSLCRYIGLLSPLLQGYIESPKRDGEVKERLTIELTHILQRIASFVDKDEKATERHVEMVKHAWQQALKSMEMITGLGEYDKLAIERLTEKISSHL